MEDNVKEIGREWLNQKTSDDPTMKVCPTG